MSDVILTRDEAILIGRYLEVAAEHYARRVKRATEQRPNYWSEEQISDVRQRNQAKDLARAIQLRADR